LNVAFVGDGLLPPVPPRLAGRAARLVIPLQVLCHWHRKRMQVVFRRIFAGIPSSHRLSSHQGCAFESLCRPLFAHYRVAVPVIPARLLRVTASPRAMTTR
jgi:hypothetical protein